MDIQHAGPTLENRIALVQVLTQGADYLGKIGYNASVGIVPEPIWAQSSSPYPYPVIPQALTVSSDVPADNSAGTGARSVTIEYLDSDWNRVVTTISLNGQTPVPVGTGMRVNRFWVVSAGSGETNIGILYVGHGTVTGGIPATALATIAAGTGQMLQAIYSVPKGKTACILDVNANLDGKGELSLYVRPFGGAFRIQRRWPCPGGHISHEYNYPSLYKEKTDIEFRAVADKGTIKAAVDFELYLW